MFSSFGSKVTLIVSRQQVLPQQGRRGGRGPGGRASSVGACSCSRGPGPSRHRADRDGVTVALRRRPGGAGQPRPAGRRVDAQQRRARPRARPASRSTSRATSRQPPLPVQRAPHLRRRATSRASCRCRRWRPCRAARSPSTSWACTPGSTATSTTTRRRRPSSPSRRSPTSAWPRPRRSPAGRKIRVTKVPVRGQREGPHQRRPARAS